MANLQDKLADSLAELKGLQNSDGLAVIRSSDLSRTHLERLVRNGFLQEVMKGWYISSRPDSSPGDTTNWYTSFWYFVSAYAGFRFGKDWCLSPDQSLVFYSGNFSVPSQVIVRISKTQNNLVDLLHNTSILYYKSDLASPINNANQYGLNLYSLQEALIECSSGFFNTDSIAARTCLGLIGDSSDLLGRLIGKGQTTKAGRLAGAFRNIGNNEVADQIVYTMKSLGFDIRESDPFEHPNPLPDFRIRSPYAARLKLMWSSMRKVVLEYFPNSNKTHADISECMRYIDNQYKQDAYHSLSIEGYKVTDRLIEKVRGGNWNPDSDQSDEKQKDAMAARGYFQAFETVKRSIRRILEGANAADIVENDNRIWYTELFAPSVTAGILSPGDLAGYRTSRVYIKGSMHVPPNPDTVRDAMPVLFELLHDETDTGVQAVLGHFLFVYIHPYMDGNGRIGRFLMNTFLIAGGYDWIVIPVERRSEYMEALESASIQGDIAPFTKFIASFLT